jgi:hypothetical protein
MPQRFSDETQELLDRAQHAIDQSIALKGLNRRRREDELRDVLRFDLNPDRQRADNLRSQNDEKRRKR